MDHVAIMKKSWGLLPKILSKEKIIESRWYTNRAAPWGKIQARDRVFFKNSGEPVTVSARVLKVETYEKLTQKEVLRLLNIYGKRDGILKSDLPTYYKLFKNKKYCLFIHLTDVGLVKPFMISKKGFGAMAAWLCTPHISIIKL